MWKTLRTEAGKKGRWGVGKIAFVFSVVSYVASSLVACLLGPVMWGFALSAGAYSWVVAYFYFPTILVYVVIALIVAAILALFAVIWAKKYEKPILIYVLVSNLIFISSLVSILLLRGQLNMIVLLVASIIGVLYPIVIILVRRHKRRKNAAMSVLKDGVFVPNTVGLDEQKEVADSLVSYKTMRVVYIVAIAVNACVGGFYLASIVSEYVEQVNYVAEQERKKEEVVDGSLGGGGVSERLGDMAYSYCYGEEFSPVYSTPEYPKEAIFECEREDGPLTFYLKDVGAETRGYYDVYVGESHDFGYTKYDEIESVVPGAIYRFRQPDESGQLYELSIAFEAESNDDLLEKYSRTLYDLLVALNDEYTVDVMMVVYFNSSLDGISTAYDKLFLNAISAVYDSYFSRGIGEYTFDVGDPYNLLNSIFADPSSYPSNARNAVKFNDHLELEVRNVRQLSYDGFLAKLKAAFKPGL